MIDYHTPFGIEIPVKAYFGWGCRNNLLQNLTSNNSDNILIICTSGAKNRPLIKEFISKVSKHNSRTSVYTGVRPNPRMSDIDLCVNEYKGCYFKHIIGIGGGSTLDQAKAIACALTHGVPIEQVISEKLYILKRNNCLTLLPTTSGTGSELSYGSILTDEKRTQKMGFRHRNLAANFAYIDPELTYNSPVDIIKITGFDVFTHALETYISKKANYFTAKLSEDALSLAYHYLPNLISNPNHKESCIHMSYASMIMGINLALSTTCLPHRLQYPVGALTDTTHSEGLAAIYPAWLNQLLPIATEKLSECNRWISSDNLNTKDSASNFVYKTISFLNDIGLHRTLQDLKIDENLIPKMVTDVKGILDDDPSYYGKESIEKIYHQSLYSI